MFICNDAGMAQHAISSGVDRIFVDLEIHGKLERQGHRDTLISGHSIHDVENVRAAIGHAELLVRVNPLHPHTHEEVDAVIAAGADLLMLPMFEKAEEVMYFVDIVQGRAKVILLVETPSAMKDFRCILRVPGIDEIYVGLNDLHISLKLDFMFELLADGSVEKMAANCQEVGIPFGFGGIARMDEGLLPGDLVLAEHLRLKSTAVILSRTFHRASTSLDEIHSNLDFAREVHRLRECETRLAQRDNSEVEADHRRLLQGVAEITAQIRSQHPR